MGGGDLNLKKSWAVNLLKNQKAVWDAEQGALKERKKIEQVRRERQEEAQIEELARLQEEAGGEKKQKRVEWMYSGASAVGSGHGTSEELEGYLLGKRRVDPLLKKQDELQKEKTTQTAAVVEADPMKDIATKVALDPLLMIQKREKDAMERQAEMEARAEERKRRRDREKERDRGGRREERRYHSDRHRHHTSSSSRRHRSRSRSPKRDSRDRKQRDRSRSPRRDSHREYRSRDEYRSREPRDARRQEPSNSSSENKAARLAAMQADASNLETDRANRLAAMSQRDKEEQAKEEQKRNKGANFKASVYQQTENVGLASRLQGSRNMSTV